MREAGSLDRGERAFRRLTAALGLFGALCLAPPIFVAVFAMEAVLEGEAIGFAPEDVPPLWWASGALAALSMLVAVRAARVPATVGLLLFACELLLFVELGARVAVRFADPPLPTRLARMGIATYPELLPVVAHPFLQYVRRDEYHRGDPYSAGPMPLAKPEGTLRVVTLGGSTTDNPWPGLMEEELARSAADGDDWEVHNLALFSYTTAHSLAKFALMGLDLEPDYVVIHHGWNDTAAWGFGDSFRGDYWHAIGPWTPPEVPVWWLARTSVVYRWLRYAWKGNEPWVATTAWRPGATAKRVDAPEPTPEERAVFERNVRSIALLARDRGAVVILATIPYSEEKAAGYPPGASRLRATNESLRRVAAGSAGEILLADLARELGPELQGYFHDLAHTKEEGFAAKARAMAAFLTARRAGQRSRGGSE